MPAIQLKKFRPSSRRARRGSALLAAIVGLGLFGASPALAHSTDDWDRAQFRDQSATCRPAKSSIYGAYISLEICWKNHEVWLRGYAEDTAADGYHAVAQIQYKIYDNGQWTTHWHTRSYIHDYGSDDAGTEGTRFAHSRYPTAQVQARACVFNGGTQIRCDSAFR